MSFDITSMRAQLDKYQGVAKTSLYMVSIDRFGTSDLEAGDLRFFCQSTNLPGISHNAIDYRPRGFGIAESIPSGVTIDHLTCVFMMDSKHEILKFFHEWSQKIINTNASNLSADIDGQLPYELGYKDEYKATITLTYYSDNNLDNAYEYTFVGAIPVSIGGVNLSFSDQNQMALLPVTFSFGSFSVSSHVTGTSQSSSNRGNGLIDFILELGTYGQVFGYRYPSRIQSLIDRYTRVKNSFDAIKTFF